MAEKVLALGLNGTEIIEAVVDKIRTAMRKDCYLADTTCYDWFEAEVDIHVRMNDTGRRPEADFNVKVELGEKDEDSALVEAEALLVVDQAPPNQVRVETHQPVPVATGDGDVKRVMHRGPARPRTER